MKTITVRLFFVVLIIMNSNVILHSQGVSVEQVTMFGNRLSSPVDVDVKEDQGKYTFFGINRSNYPYDFEIKFTSLQNLSPMILERKLKLLPGNNRLFTLNIVNAEEAANFSYQISFRMSSPDIPADLNFPYLIPIGKNKTIELYSFIKDNLKTYYRDYYLMNRGDTVFAARKGVVTALPDNETKVERIIETGSLEVRQGDWTIAVYTGIDPASCFVKLGQEVFPGQPVGLIGGLEKLAFNVYELKDDGKLHNINIRYADNNGELITKEVFFGFKPSYNETVIKKEMTKKELSKYAKGTLY
jgi:hypothetical protein